MSREAKYKGLDLKCEVRHYTVNTEAREMCVWVWEDWRKLLSVIRCGMEKILLQPHESYKWFVEWGTRKGKGGEYTLLSDQVS